MTQTSDSPSDPEAVTEIASEIDAKLLEILVCPVTKGPLVYDRTARELVSAKARLAFPVRSGVPLLTVEAARSLDAELGPNNRSR